MSTRDCRANTADCFLFLTSSVVSRQSIFTQTIQNIHVIHGQTISMKRHPVWSKKLNFHCFQLMIYFWLPLQYIFQYATEKELFSLIKIALNDPQMFNLVETNLGGAVYIIYWIPLNKVRDFSRWDNTHIEREKRKNNNLNGTGRIRLQVLAG